ncbi:undecaprenyl diphosphate synthase [Thermosinus carboxydivorans Nor1]|uniref:Isoprenyl transferase n=1 Tax=Thermosinus carboxydivorans Nor1 TaxID=401526 RepID=A1HN01_9FIRM|nr:isoprenyl transferase [Thermosinus carboxydivorans]EAX48632.1 undecaprenyl diphosphate synthase [Thermosinus carboxydivorans Nor1]
MWKKWFSNKSDVDQNQSYLQNSLDPNSIPAHIAIIMDGNGRWAQKRGLPRTLGHHAGAETLRNIVKTAAELGVKVLTAYAFSTENWKRPAEEVDVLMRLLSDYLDSEIDELDSNNVQIRFIGKTDELAPSLYHKVTQAQKRTSKNTGLILNLAVNYGGRAELTRAVQLIARKVAAGVIAPDNISEQTIQDHLYTADLPDPDLLIRPSGDLRLSNFLLWQSAYTEFWFTNTNWPDFTPDHLIQAIADYQRRDRRFGGLKTSK